jgi:hypothetical protein
VQRVCVIAGDDERRDDRPGGGAGEVDPGLGAGLLGGFQRSGKGDPLDPAALEDAVGSALLTLRGDWVSFLAASG